MSNEGNFNSHVDWLAGIGTIIKAVLSLEGRAMVDLSLFALSSRGFLMLCGPDLETMCLLDLGLATVN